LYIVEQEFARNNPFFRNISNNEVSGDSATLIANLKRPQLKLQGNALFWVTSSIQRDFLNMTGEQGKPVKLSVF
jgi:hypothetical protein